MRFTAQPKRGLTMLETLIALAFIAVALLGIVSSIISVMKTTDLNREEMIAMNAIRMKASEMEAMENTRDFNAIFATYINASNKTFAVSGLDGGSGTIYFPVDGTGTQLVEQPVFADPHPELMGMPRDLNGDGKIDSADHSADYTILPFTIRINWNSGADTRQLEYHGMLSALRNVN